MKSLGEKLKDIRIGQGLSMDELANLLNKKYQLTINKSMISRWENNKSEPYNTYLSAYAKEFNVDMNYLLGIIDEEKQETKAEKLEHDFPEGISVLYRAHEELTPEQKEMMLKMINSVFFDKNGENK